MDSAASATEAALPLATEADALRAHVADMQAAQREYLARLTSSELPPVTTFRELIAVLAMMDSLPTMPPIDHAQVLASLHDKVDALKRVIDQMETTEAHFAAHTRPLDKKRLSISKERDRLRSYVAHSMRGDFLPEEQRQRTDEVPGEVYTLRLRDNAGSLTLKRSATPQDVVDFPQYARMDRAYSWDKEAVAAAIKAGTFEGDFAELTPSVWPEWVPRVPKSLAPKRKGAKK